MPTGTLWPIMYAYYVRSERYTNSQGGRLENYGRL